jgi:phenylpropionate dioxygenase-like ring-hydroxylating dioxygenase large terminal subunit
VLTDSTIPNLKHDSLLLRNHWYIACASLLLEQEPLAAQVLDQPLMLFRDAAGAPHALLDRCSHRGLPLSMGQVIEGTVACAYHGWRFDGSGACVHIPSLVEGRHIPAGCKVPAFACQEHDGYVWVWMGEDAGALPPCPRVPDFARLAWTQGTSLWQCAAERALENFFDWCHPAFAHRASRHPQAVRVEEEGFRETAYEMRLQPDGMLVFAPPLPVPVPLPEAGLPGGPEPGEEEAAIADHATVVSRFQLPCRATMQRPRAGVRVVLHFIATGPGSCRVEWLTHHAGLGDQPGVTWAEQENLILEEDRVILEASQPWYDAGDTSFECSVEADAVTLMLRRVLALARHGRWAAEWEGLRQRRVVRVRT